MSDNTFQLTFLLIILTHSKWRRASNLDPEVCA